MQALEISPPSEDTPAGDDYARIRAALEFIGAQAKRQPRVEEIADHVGLSPSHLHHLFQRWAGISPKGFLQAVTIDHARRLLRDNASLLDASLELGLSGPARLHDLFVTQEAMTPGEYKTGGAGLAFAYGFHSSPFGEALAVVAPRGLAGLGFVDAAGREAALADMRRRWPKAEFREDAAATAPYVRRAFDPDLWRADQPLRVVLIGSDFEVQVWRALLKIPLGAATTYSDVASDIGRTGAARAVGAAVGRNPISFVVPCHRVLGRSGALTGYHWGLVRKQAIIGWEAGRCGAR
ncbi:MAG: methylated-DNA--[protein]-cysteine S-methyltransferase [Hyphomicrobiales bacterium]|nr:methylated-DNA--[protein]-cysteine S-methyltransferase [Hyphomicrobiales bacterium]